MLESLRRVPLATRAALLAAALLLLLLPLYAVSYWVEFWYFFFLLLTLAGSYDIVGGHMGYINLGHSTFFGLGAYAFGITLFHGWGLGAAFLFSGLVPVAFAALISIPFFRLRGAYFALATLSLIFLMELLANNLVFLTMGADGLSITPEDRLIPVYYISFALALLTIGTVASIARSRFGLALRSIREDEAIARAVGINTTLYKALGLMLSALFPGLMGGVFMWHESFLVPPDAFGLEIAFVPIVMAMLGGTGAVLGPVVGALFVTGIEEILWTRLAYLHLAAYGVALILVGVFMPGGLVRAAPVRRLLSRAFGGLRI